MGNTLTDEELKRMVQEEKLSYLEIARRTGFARVTISKRCQRMGITTKHPTLEGDEEEIERLYKAGTPIAEIAKITHHAHESIRNYLNKNNLYDINRMKKPAEEIDENALIRVKKKPKKRELFLVPTRKIRKNGQWVQLYKKMVDVTDEIFETDDVELFEEGRELL